MLLLAVELAVLCSLLDSSSMIMLLSAADGMVGKKRTFSLGDVGDISLTSSCTACCRTRRGLTILTVDLPTDGTGVVLVALDRDRRKVDVLAVVPDADESFLELDKFESCDVFRVTSHEECLRRVSNIRSGIEQ